MRVSGAKPIDRDELTGAAVRRSRADRGRVNGLERERAPSWMDRLATLHNSLRNRYITLQRDYADIYAANAAFAAILLSAVWAVRLPSITRPDFCGWHLSSAWTCSSKHADTLLQKSSLWTDGIICSIFRRKEWTKLCSFFWLQSSKKRDYCIIVLWAGCTIWFWQRAKEIKKKVIVEISVQFVHSCSAERKKKKKKKHNLLYIQFSLVFWKLKLVGKQGYSGFFFEVGWSLKRRERNGEVADRPHAADDTAVERTSDGRWYSECCQISPSCRWFEDSKMGNTWLPWRPHHRHQCQQQQHLPWHLPTECNSLFVSISIWQGKHLHQNLIPPCFS